MKKATIIPVLLVSILLAGGTAFAWSGHGQRNYDQSCNRSGQGMTQEQHAERMNNRLEKMAVILDLTDQQKEKIENLFAQKMESHQAMRTEMQASRNALRAYKQGKEFNESEFRAKAQKHADLKTEMMVQHAKTRQQVLAVLTPEQQQKADKLRNMHGEGFFGKHDGYRDSGNRNCAGHGRRGGKGSGPYYNN